MKTTVIFFEEFNIFFEIFLYIVCDYKFLGVGPFLPPRWGPLLFLLSSIYEAGWTSGFAGLWPPNVHVAISISLWGFWISTSNHQTCSPSICPSGAISLAPYFDIIFFLKNGHHKDARKTALCWLLRGRWMADEAWLMPMMATVIILVVLTWWFCCFVLPTEMPLNADLSTFKFHGDRISSCKLSSL